MRFCLRALTKSACRTCSANVKLCQNLVRCDSGRLTCAAAMQEGGKDNGKAAQAATRMADLDDTIEKLVAVAKRKGYIDADCTVASLKAEAAKNKDKEVQEDAVSLMTAMKKNLDAQTTAVRALFCALVRVLERACRCHFVATR